MTPTNKLWLVVALSLNGMGQMGCTHTDQAVVESTPKMTVRRAKPDAPTMAPVKQKLAKQKQSFNRLCSTATLTGCDELSIRERRAKEASRQKDAHLALYEPLVRKLRLALDTPARAPDARIESSLKLAEGRLNYAGPHSVKIRLEVVYDSWRKRHPRSADIALTLKDIKELNRQLEAKENIYEESYREIKESLVKLTFEQTTVFIPQDNQNLLTAADSKGGSIVYALVISEPGLKYRVVKEWRQPMLPALTLTQREDEIEISASGASTAVFTETYSVQSEEVCNSLRAEVRLLVSGTPRRKWSVTRRETEAR